MIIKKIIPSENLLNYQPFSFHLWAFTLMKSQNKKTLSSYGIFPYICGLIVAH